MSGDFNELREAILADKQEEQTTTETETTDNVETVAEPQIQNETTSSNEEVSDTPTNVESTVKVTDFANEELAEANRYLKNNPEKTLKDYYELKTPVENLDEDVLLKEYLSEKEGKTKTAVELELKKLELDDDFDDDDSIEALEKKAKKEELLSKAREYRAEKINELLADKEDATTNESEAPKQSYEEQFKEWQTKQDAIHKEYLQDVYSAESGFNEIDLVIGGENVKFQVTDDFKKQLRTVAESPIEYTNQFFDPNGTGKLIKSNEYLEDLAWMNRNTRTNMIRFIEEQAVARYRAKEDRNSRNVNLTNRNEDIGNATGNVEEKLDQFYNKSKRFSF